MLPERCRPQGHHGPYGWLADRGAQHRMRRRNRTLALPLWHTRGTVKRRRGKIPRAIEGQEGVTIEPRHRGKRLAALALPQDAREPWAEPLGGARSKERAPRRVTRDTLAPIAGVEIARSPLLI